MEVILLEHIEKLGKMGDRVNVKTGYARIAYFEAQKAALELHNQELLGKASALAASLNGFNAILIRQAAETGQLYGSGTIRDISAAITDAGFDVERRYIYLEKPIKDLGVYKVKLNLHPEVSQTILINVARSSEEAKKQAKAYNQE